MNDIKANRSDPQRYVIKLPLPGRQTDYIGRISFVSSGNDKKVKVWEQVTDTPDTEDSDTDDADTDDADTGELDTQDPDTPVFTEGKTCKVKSLQC